MSQSAVAKAENIAREGLGALKEGVQKLNHNLPTLGNESKYFQGGDIKVDEIKKLLDSKNDKDKMEAMKRIVGIISQGRDARSLFPDVVKNVVVQHLEVRKLVYMYLVHYAELEPDTALLSINTFQKAQADKNPLIRALGLRVMSSMRVRDIAGLIVLSLKTGVKDSSPFVRKTAAIALPKVVRLDSEQREAVIPLLGDLLIDKNTSVLGATIAAFNEICPENVELLHPHYRKLCRTLADIDEWGQVCVLDALLRYARAFFANPDPTGKGVQKSENFYEDENQTPTDDGVATTSYDSDYRLLMDSAAPLLQSRNPAVVMAVVSLYHYAGSPADAARCGKALARLVRDRREISYVVLSNIASIATSRPDFFHDLVDEFFINPSEPLFSKTLKLEILTHIATENNITKILNEFKTYIKFEDKIFVASTIQAIGRAAVSINEILHACLKMLMSLIGDHSEVVVGEAVVVIRKLLQHSYAINAFDEQLVKIVVHLIRLLDDVKAPLARASIVWVVGEYSDKVSPYCADVLRKMTKSFVNEADITKMEIITFSSKLITTSHPQLPVIAKFTQHVLNLAKYDRNYDIRDKARLVRVMLATKLRESLPRLLHTKKPQQVEASLSKDRSRYVLGTLSHITNSRAAGYTDLPEWAPQHSDSTLREEPVGSQYDIHQASMGSEDYTGGYSGSHYAPAIDSGLKEVNETDFYEEGQQGDEFYGDEGYYEEGFYEEGYEEGYGEDAFYEEGYEEGYEEEAFYEEGYEEGYEETPAGETQANAGEFYDESFESGGYEVMEEIQEAPAEEEEEEEVEGEVPQELLATSPRDNQLLIATDEEPNEESFFDE